MRKAKEATAVYTSRSGKPAARVMVDGRGEVNLHKIPINGASKLIINPSSSSIIN